MRFKPGLEAGHAEELTGITESGEMVRVINWLVTEEEASQIRQGYRCLKCMEPFETPFPKVCNLCGYEVGARQAHDVPKEDTGETKEILLDEMKPQEYTGEKEQGSRIWTPPTTEMWGSDA